jgi:hypothetical protein
MHREVIMKLEEDRGLENSEFSDEEEGNEAADLEHDTMKEYFNEHPDVREAYGRADGNGGCLICLKDVDDTARAVYDHAVRTQKKHTMLHRAFAQVLAELHEGLPKPVQRLPKRVN